MEQNKKVRQVFFDTETTGKKKDYDRIVEIALVEAYDNIPTGKVYHTVINPERPIPEEAIKIHNITDEIAASAPLFREVMPEIIDFIRGAECLAYNIEYDSGILNAELVRAGHDETYWEITDNNIDVLQIARAVYPGKRNKLDNVLERLKIDTSSRDNGHGALIDTNLMIDAYVGLLKYYDGATVDLESDKPRAPVKYLNLGNYVPLSIELSDEDISNHEKYLDGIQKTNKVTPVERKEAEVASPSPKRPSM